MALRWNVGYNILYQSIHWRDTMKAAPTVQPLLTFGQCLKNILGARKLSASALSRMMEQKSRNSMFRILDDTGGPAVQAAFF